MTFDSASVLRATALVSFAACLMGCPNPNTYGTPRTVPPGELQHTIAVEGLHLAADTPGVVVNADGTTNRTIEKNSATVPMVPTYQLRVGLADRVDLGVRLANLSSLGVDVKWNFYRSDVFDVAIDPGAQAIYVSSNGTSIFLSYFHVPLILGFNFNESVTAVLAGGLVGAYASASVSDSSSSTTASESAGGFGIRGGFGLQFRTSEKFALHPEVNVMRFLSGPAGDNKELAIVFGLGFNFGHLPKYKAEAPPVGAPDPAPKPAPASNAAQ